MRLLTVILCFCASGAFAQLDHILAPLPTESEMAKQEIALVSTLQGDPASPGAHRIAGAASGSLNANDLLKLLQTKIADYYSIKGELRLDFVNLWDPISLPADDFDAVITEYPPDGLTGAFYIRCKIVSGGEKVGEWQIGLHAQLWQDVWVADAALARDQQIDRSLVKVQKIDVLHEKETFLSADDDPSNYDVVQPIAEGHPLAKRDVVERPLIHKGQVVDVIAHQGLLDVRMKGMALEDGAANDLIRMRNLDSLKGFNAQVINENQVEVHF